MDTNEIILKQARRTNDSLAMPKYRNAEMLMLEFFLNENITMRPRAASDTHTFVALPNTPTARIDACVQYINDNI